MRLRGRRAYIGLGRPTTYVGCSLSRQASFAAHSSVLLAQHFLSDAAHSIGLWLCEPMRVRFSHNQEQLDCNTKAESSACAG